MSDLVPRPRALEGEVLLPREATAQISLPIDRQGFIGRDSALTALLYLLEWLKGHSTPEVWEQVKMACRSLHDRDEG